jgi:hypothetical protein
MSMHVAANARQYHADLINLSLKLGVLLNVTGFALFIIRRHACAARQEPSDGVVVRIVRAAAPCQLGQTTD